MQPSGSTLVVDLRPGITALTGVVSVLHSRAADIADMTYAVHEGRACLQFVVNGTKAQACRLAAQVDRRADVLAVRVRPRVG
jgi:predicted amino acid-binding ACT domain protein